MAVFARTNTFVSGASITASGHNTNWDDVTTWLNNRYNGSDTWSFMKVSSTDSNPVDISSSGATTEVSINNSATDGDPILTWKLSGNQKFVIGVDDSDSDMLKFGTTGLGTNVAFMIPSGGNQVQFADGSALLPSISLFSFPTTGFYKAGSNDLGVTNGGGQTAVFTAGHQFVVADGVSTAGSIAFINDLDTGIWRAGGNTLGIQCGAVESARFDASGSANDTRMLIYDVTRAAMVRVSVGGSDTGGSGFRVLRVPN
jgi:hypothetical protein